MKYLNELHAQVFAIAFLAGVLGNLVASALWGIPTLRQLHRKLNKHHNWHLEKDANAKGD